jgi:hypothetical protein
MKQHQQMQLREVSLPEAVALAVARRRQLLRRGKTTRRITIPLPAHLIPPPSGRYECSLGEVKISSCFKHEEGKWILLVVLPEESFKVKDFVSDPSSSPDNPQQ